jgi:site-specific DNA-methyltransferase (adenine-specific)
MPIPADLLNTITLGDSLELLKTLPDKCFDLLLTDPPYGHALESYPENIERTGGTWASKYGNKIKKWDEAPSPYFWSELFRVSKNQIVWGGNYFNLPPTRCFNVWKKLTISENFTMAMCEYAWTSFNQNAKCWEFAPQDKARFHPTQKPVNLIVKQLQTYAGAGQIILDPFSGSGSVAIACHRLGLDFVAIERDPDYHRASLDRLANERAQLRLPL